MIPRAALWGAAVVVGAGSLASAEPPTSGGAVPSSGVETAPRVLSGLEDREPDSAPRRWRGADVSLLPELERAGATWRDDVGRLRDPLALLSAAGCDIVRIRIWYEVSGGAGGMEDGLAIARRARTLGLAFWIDLHYSESWADPGQQTTPRAWAGLSPAALADSVASYTDRVVSRFRDEAGAPAIVQLGNEISAGLLWPAARLTDWNDAESWDRLGEIWNAGEAGARRAAPEVQIVLHLDPTPGPDGVLRFLREIRNRGARVDGLALSYYPWWHGGIARLDDFVRALETAEQPWYLAEVAYPWSLGAFDAETNLVGAGASLAEGFAPSAEGQARFLRELRRRIDESTFGRGILYWEPEWVTAPAVGSVWENCALFDLMGKLLPGAHALWRREEWSR